ncbi:MAG TPA: ferredoxin [Pseudonocardiaceae bacterium]|nr:ferredoxin [Pseudonocardiaceae bacterium]
MTDTRWRITVDRGTCIGSAVCVGTLPHRFKLVDDKSVPIDDEIEPDDEVAGAAESCPMEAILVVNAESGEVIAPEV